MKEKNIILLYNKYLHYFVVNEIDFFFFISKINKF